MGIILFCGKQLREAKIGGPSFLVAITASAIEHEPSKLSLYRIKHATLT
jgi:hypothetical protein